MNRTIRNRTWRATAGLALVVAAAGCLDEGKYRRDQDALRKQIDAERSGAQRARADAGRLRVERDAWREKLARLESDLARLRDRLEAAPAAPTDAGGERRAAALRQIGALQDRTSQLRARPDAADDPAQAKREAELTKLQWDKEDLERGLREYAALLDRAPDPTAPTGGTP